MGFLSSFFTQTLTPSAAPPAHIASIPLGPIGRGSDSPDNRWCHDTDHACTRWSNAGLNNHLGAILAWKECDINRTALHIGTALVENGIDFDMTDI